MNSETPQAGGADMLHAVHRSSPEYACRLRDLCWAAGAGAAVNVMRGFHPNPGKGTLWVDPYWVGFYLRSYGDGFRRRALIGTMCRALFPNGVPVLLLNVTGVLMVLGCVMLLFGALCRLAAERRSAWTNLIIFALAASTATSAFYETTGDLLHIVLLLFCGTAMLSARYLPSSIARTLVVTATVLLAFFMHEASIFLLAPAMPFFLKARPALRDFVLPLLLYAGLIALSMHWSTEAVVAHPVFHANLVGRGVQMADPTLASNFRNQLAYERWLYFRTREAKISFVIRCARITELALAYLVALALTLPRRALQRTLLVLACILAGSAPLWVIAIDWGRFLTYALLLALVSSWLWEWEPSAFDLPALVQRAANRLEGFSAISLVPLLAVFVLVTSSEFFSTHVEGVGERDGKTVLVVAALGVLVWLVRSRSPAVMADS